MLTTSHYSQSNGNYVLKPGRQLTVSTCLAIAQYCLHRVSDGWLMQNTYLFNSMNRSVTRMLMCFAPHSHSHNQSQPWLAIQWVNTLVKKECLREITLPLAALQSPFNVQTQEQTHHGQQWLSRHDDEQMNIQTIEHLAVRLKFNCLLSYFTWQSIADVANVSLYTKYEHVVDSDSTEHPLLLLGQSRRPSDGWKMHSYHAHTVDVFIVLFICLLIYPWQAWVHSWLTSWPHCPDDIILGQRDLHVQIWFLVDGWWPT